MGFWHIEVVAVEGVVVVVVAAVVDSTAGAAAEEAASAHDPALDLAAKVP